MGNYFNYSNLNILAGVAFELIFANGKGYVVI